MSPSSPFYIRTLKSLADIRWSECEAENSPSCGGKVNDVELHLHLPYIYIP
jgi:hypothetical protein